MSAMSDKDIDRHHKEELENELVEVIQMRKECEKKEEELTAKIRKIDAKFITLDIVDWLSKPLAKLLSPIDGDEETSHRSEIEDDDIGKHKAEEEWKRQGS